MCDKYFFLNFQIGSQTRFDNLRRFFAALKLAKDQIIESWELDAEQLPYDPADDPKWLECLDDAAVDWFADTFDYNSEEGKTYLALWTLTAPEIRTSHPMFCPPGNWNFESMIDTLFKGEYRLVDLVQESETNGVLYYDPWAGPFGGSEPLAALVESFGNTVTYDSWHNGPHLRQTIGWGLFVGETIGRGGKRIRAVTNAV